MIWKAIPVWMKRVYDVCLSTGCFPSVWKTARVVVLLKSPEKVRLDPGSYRPISLLFVLGKGLERMMVRRLERLMDGRMCDAQYGFAKGRSTEDAWECVKEWVNVSTKKYILGLFVDIKGAFEDLEWKCVIEKLRGISCEEIGLWVSYFSERRVCMSSANETEECPVWLSAGVHMWSVYLELDDGRTVVAAM